MTLTSEIRGPDDTSRLLAGAGPILAASADFPVEWISRADTVLDRYHDVGGVEAG